MVVWGVDLPVDDFGHEIFDFSMAIGEIPDIEFFLRKDEVLICFKQ